jgi:phosphoribosylglycinamide formyltransferase-1
MSSEDTYESGAGRGKVALIAFAVGLIAGAALLVFIGGNPFSTSNEVMYMDVTVASVSDEADTLCWTTAPSDRDDAQPCAILALDPQVSVPEQGSFVNIGVVDIAAPGEQTRTQIVYAAPAEEEPTDPAEGTKASGPPAEAKRLVVLISGAGSNLSALLSRDDLGGRVVLVAADRADAGGLRPAVEAGVDTAAVERGDFAERGAWESVLAERVSAAEPHLVVLAGFMKILSPAFVDRWPLLNVHPSLLPAFPGAHAVEAALDYGVKVTGCTVHFVDEKVDHGPIVAQEPVPVHPGDDPERLHARIRAVEHRLLGDAVALFCHDRLHVDGRQVRRLT